MRNVDKEKNRRQCCYWTGLNGNFETADIFIYICLSSKGLVVPVIRSVEGMNYADIEKAIADLGEKVRLGTVIHACCVLLSLPLCMCLCELYTHANDLFWTVFVCMC